MPVTRYVWDMRNDSYLMEKDGNGQTTVVYTNKPVPYGHIISQRRNGQTRYHRYDGQQSTRQLTDENQNVTDTATYTAFGKTVAKTGASVNPFGYKGSLGYYIDRISDDVYIRERTYSPISRRWLSTDPIGFKDGPNLYVVCHNDPLNNSDPSGQKCVVCRWLRYMGPNGPTLAEMDSWFVSPQNAVTRTVANFWNSTWSQPNERVKFTNLPPAPTRVGPIPSFKNTKPYGRIKVGEETFYGYLFVIVADVCELPKPYGTCIVTIDEKVKREIKIQNKPWQVEALVTRPRKTLDPDRTGNVFMGRLAKPDDPRCPWRLVIPDFPIRSQFLKVPIYRQATVDQIVSIYDSGATTDKWWVGQRFAQGANSVGVPKFHWQSLKSTKGDPNECC